MVGICAPGRTRIYSVACLPLRMCWSETGCVSAARAVKVTTTYAASECGGQRARTRLPSFPLDQHGLPLLLRRVTVDAVEGLNLTRVCVITAVVARSESVRVVPIHREAHHRAPPRAPHRDTDSARCAAAPVPGVLWDS